MGHSILKRKRGQQQHTMQQKFLNFKISTWRVVIENVFASAKKWRILGTRYRNRHLNKDTDLLPLEQVYVWVWGIIKLYLDKYPRRKASFNPKCPSIEKFVTDPSDLRDPFDSYEGDDDLSESE